nr:hypothetical protein BaRGS_029242 [Batillaria attramentaria]
MDTVVSSTSQSRKESSSGQGHHEKLGQQVQKLLQETAYLTGSSRARDREQLQRPGVTTVSQTEGRTGEGVNSQSTGKGQTTNLDYDRLHRDLQEIQDSLQVMGQPAVDTPPPVNAAKMDSDNEGDIVPSTTTTPERGRRLVWDYAADLGYRHGDMAQLEGMMSDATESSPLNPSDNLRYTSDGEETRTSGSSVKEHGEEEEHHDDSVNLTLTGHHAAPTTGEMELEELISTFRSESRALESRYQAVRSQGLADKVFGILTNSNPDQQAQGILSEISAEEQRLRQAQLTQVPTHGYGSSYSESSPSTSLPNFSLKGDDAVRKRLDLSTLSDSADGSHLHASSLDASGKCLVGKDVGFVATSTAQTLISAQMKKMADRTFNHSIELRSPVWC